MTKGEIPAQGLSSPTKSSMKPTPTGPIAAAGVAAHAVQARGRAVQLLTAACTGARGAGPKVPATKPERPQWVREATFAGCVPTGETRRFQTFASAIRR